MEVVQVIAKRIKDILDTKQVIEYYGFKINRQGFILCPFHKDKKTESLKIYQGDRGWHCFGCGRNGSVIDFVMLLFNLDYKQAITRLDYDFRLGLTNQKPDARQLIEFTKRKKEKEEIKNCEKLIKEYWTLEFIKYRRQLQDNKPKQTFEPLSDEFIEALLKLPIIADRLGGDHYY